MSLIARARHARRPTVLLGSLGSSRPLISRWKWELLQSTCVFATRLLFSDDLDRGNIQVRRGARGGKLLLLSNIAGVSNQSVSDPYG